MSTSLKRIKILKTGLWGVHRYIDFAKPKEVKYFEKIASPGTELILKRAATDDEPWRIEVFGPDERFLGRVTVQKSETAARLMDAGMKIIAIVNDSMIEGTDMISTQVEPGDEGWSLKGRMQTKYDEVNLPFSIYLEE